ncbi:hypothetical protein BSKO_06904 [Bryopsis sp. KO-2023]|nr:hypothetical protein BSKO_06904 [Bryopsis sp. KO-2023]
MVECVTEGGSSSQGSSARPFYSREQLKRLYADSIECNGGHRILQGILAKADSVTTNKRKYPKALLKREVKKYQSYIRRGTAVGELDHPNYSSPYFKQISFANVSHSVLEVHWDGSLLVGTLKILPSPSGKLVWELCSQGLRIGASLRGWSSVVADDTTDCSIVQSDFQLVTFDLVPAPAISEGYVLPLATAYKGNLEMPSSLLRLTCLGYGATSLRGLANAIDLKLLMEWVKDRRIEFNSDTEGRKRMSDVWHVGNCTLSFGSYIGTYDGTSHWLQKTVPGLRLFSEHWKGFALRVLAENNAKLDRKTANRLATLSQRNRWTSSTSEQEELKIPDVQTPSCFSFCKFWKKREVWSG